jgi:hypothetical protein
MTLPRGGAVEESVPGSTHPAELASDPTTIIGLIFRVLNRPSRTVCLLAILALVLAGIGELVHAPPIAGLPVSVWGVAVSGGSITSLGTSKLLHYLRSRKQLLVPESYGDP